MAKGEGTAALAAAAAAVASTRSACMICQEQLMVTVTETFTEHTGIQLRGELAGGAPWRGLRLPARAVGVGVDPYGHKGSIAAPAAGLCRASASRYRA